MFEKCSNTKFRKIPSSWSRLFPRGPTYTDMMNLITAFRNFSEAHKKGAQVFRPERQTKFCKPITSTFFAKTILKAGRSQAATNAFSLSRNYRILC